MYLTDEEFQLAKESVLNSRDDKPTIKREVKC